VHLSDGREKAKGQNAEEIKKLKVSKLIYLLFLLPFVLACLCWLWFPILARHIVVYGFGYVPSPQNPHWLWSGTLYLFFTVYVFITIGLGGAFVVAAWIWRRKKRLSKTAYYPTVSFIVPAYNEEKMISRCIKSLSAAQPTTRASAK
jgi:Glycosyl transferase family 2.